MRRVLDDVGLERVRQDARWGEQNHADGHGDFHVGLNASYARMVNDLREKKGSLAWDWILLEEVAEALEAEGTEHLREELIQVAAVAVAWVEAIDRRTQDSSVGANFGLAGSQPPVAGASDPNEP